VHFVPALPSMWNKKIRHRHKTYRDMEAKDKIQMRKEKEAKKGENPQKMIIRLK
jgi:hypothetical protein